MFCFVFFKKKGNRKNQNQMKIIEIRKNGVVVCTVDDVQDGRIGEELQLVQAELLQVGAVHFLSSRKREKR